MWDLRWVLLGLGALAVAGVYLWSRGVLSYRALPGFKRRAERTEPSIGGYEEGAVQEAPPVDVVAEAPKRPFALDRIVALRLVPRSDELQAVQVVRALRSAGLAHGRYSIFHRELSGNVEAFSVASLTEPGSFDLDHLDDSTVAGLSFFVVLPGEGDPVARFDAMVETARGLSVELAADLFDERGSSWSSQRERYLREELIEYRHQLERR
jgi:cell division protein ZipA